LYSFFINKIEKQLKDILYIKYKMELAEPKQFQRGKKKETKINSIYSRGMITRSIVLPFTSIGKNIKETIEQNISSSFEGKCLVEGYVKPGSSKIVSYSSGLIQRGAFISFEVVFECLVCFQVEGALISCVAKNITKAGIRAESATETPSPIVVFIAKDHNYMNSYFSSVQEGDTIIARVIGQRFELNDKYISIIAELVNTENQAKPVIG
jgi:DNA-directed RNA polymerase subunit E'/Rpb7